MGIETPHLISGTNNLLLVQLKMLADLSQYNQQLLPV